MANLDRYTLAQQTVIGSMLWEDKRVPLVLSKLTEEDFIDPTCRNFFRAIRELALEGKPIDPVTVIGKLKAGEDYVRWAHEAMEVTPSPANVGSYIPQVLEGAMLRRFWSLCAQGAECTDVEEAVVLARKMSSCLSAAERRPRMSAAELSKDFLDRMRREEKPKYLPWGIPIADRVTYAELGDMILLGGYASSGKTLLSILMAMAQARAGYRVGYYSLETRPEKMADRIFASLAKVPMDKIKKRSFGEDDWRRLAESANDFVSECPFDIIPTAGTTVDDIAADAIGSGYQVIYVDYVQLLRAPGVRDTDGYARVTAVSQSLKTFAQSTGTAVVALAQLTRPPGDKENSSMPTMHSFKESGQLEQDADAAFLVFPVDRTNNSSNRLFRVVKNKEGARPDPVELVFHGDTQTMVELEARPDRSVATEMSDIGREARRKNRTNGQMEFRELRDGDDDNPFA